MIQMERREFTQAMFVMRSKYPQNMIDDDKFVASVNTYWDVLQHFEADRVRRALADAPLVHKEHIPTLGQLVAMAKSDGNLETAINDGWNEALVLARNRNFEFPKNKLGKVMRAMFKERSDWGNMENSHKPYERNRFDRIWRGMEQDELRGDHRPTLKPVDETKELPADVKKLAGNIAAGMTMPGGKEDSK